MVHDESFRRSEAPARRRLGDFEILREVGRGGMGIVYEARQISLNRNVALKVLSGVLGLSPQAVQRFRREAEAAARLHHTNIVPIYATGEVDGTHYYAMELIQGPSLDQVIRAACRSKEHRVADVPLKVADDTVETVAYAGEPIAPQHETPAWTSSTISSGSHYFDTVARVMADVSDALEYAHRQGIVHRDIKPANLLVSPDGKLSLNDFGLARVLEEPGMTATGEMLGTPAYMSPEQITAGRTPLDHRTDIYSLGATLYELLTLQRPFTGDRRDQVLAQILHKEPKPLRRINKKVPIDLETICLKAMDKDPDRRYQTAGAMAEDLRRYVNRFAIQARRIGPIARLTKWISRHPGLTSATVCAAVAIIAAAYFASQQQNSELQRLTEQRLSNEQFTTLRRQHALENAIVAATSGDLEAAERAIDVAEANGASPAEIRLLRGELALFGGEFETALSELEQAVKLEPENLSAHSMLATTLFTLGDFTRYLQELEIIEKMQPRTAQECLWKGYAQIDFNAGRPLLDEAIRRNRSPLALAMRGEGLCYKSLEAEEFNIPGLKNAVEDVRAARELLPTNLFVLSTSVWVHTNAAIAYRLMNLSDEEQATLRVATKDVNSIESFASLAGVGRPLLTYYRFSGDDEKYFDLARRMAEMSSVPNQLIPLAHVMCQRKQFDEALKLMDKRKWRDVDGDFLRVYIEAELNPHDHRIVQESMAELYARYSSSSTEESHFSGLDPWRRLAYLLGMKNEAIQAFRAARQRLPQDVHIMERRYFDFGAGDIDVEELLRTKSSRDPMLHARFLAGLKSLADGDRERARELFQSAKEVHITEAFVIDVIDTFLVRMEQDPDWPPWIPRRQ